MALKSVVNGSSFFSVRVDWRNLRYIRIHFTRDKYFFSAGETAVSKTKLIDFDSRLLGQFGDSVRSSWFFDSETCKV